MALEMQQRLKLPVPVLLFPEGTSTNGDHVLAFHPSLFEPPVRAGATVTSAAVRYVIEGGVPESELCWFGEAPFLPHLWKALGTPGFTARVVFGQPATYADRRQAARATHAQVSEMRIIMLSGADAMQPQLLP